MMLTYHYGCWRARPFGAPIRYVAFSRLFPACALTAARRHLPRPRVMFTRPPIPHRLPPAIGRAP